eukprot:jgi/Mesvir1/8833/Mv02732-RA.1
MRSHEPYYERTRYRRREEDVVDDVKRETERELEELERMCRTVYAYNLNSKADERDLFEYFSQAGTVADVRLIMDKNSRRSKGLAYIEFVSRDSVPAALALSGHIFMETAVMVKPSEAEKNVVNAITPGGGANTAAAAAAAAAASLAMAETGSTRLTIDNLHPSLLEEDIQAIFDPFGTVEDIGIIKDENGVSTGKGYVQYSTGRDAQKAIQQLNGLDLAGRKIEVVLPAPPPGATPTPTPGALEDAATAQARLALLARMQAAQLGIRPPGIPGMPAFGALGGIPGLSGLLPALPGMLPSVPPLPTLHPAGLPGLVPGGAGSASVSAAMAAAAAAVASATPIAAAGALRSPLLAPASSMAAANMMDLSAAGGALGGAGAALDAGGIVISPLPTKCIVLRNMFDPATETDPEWHLDIQDDVEEECSKYGKILGCHVDKDSQGFVYLRFERVEDAVKGKEAMHSRWFAGRTLTVDYLVESSFLARFPSS